MEPRRAHTALKYCHPEARFPRRRISPRLFASTSEIPKLSFRGAGRARRLLRRARRRGICCSIFLKPTSLDPQIRKAPASVSC
jgi:hypothetical protein